MKNSVAHRNRRRLLSAILFLLPVGVLLAQNTSQPSPSSAAVASPTPSIADRLADAVAEKRDAKRYGKILEVTSHLTLADIPIALEAASSMPDSKKNRELRTIYSAIFKRWAQLRDPKTLLPETEKIEDPGLRSSVASTVITQWSIQDPAGAYVYVLPLPQGSRRDALLNSVLTNWAKINPDAAIAAIEKSTPGELPYVAINSLLRGLINEYPERALTIWLAAQSSHGPKDAMRYTNDLEGIFGRLGQIDPKKGIERAKALKRQDWQNVAYAGITRGWSGTDPKGAFDWLQKSKLFTPRRGEIVFENWGRIDPKGATQAIATLKGENRTAMSLVVARGWMITDPAAARVWAQSLPDSQDKSSFLASGIIALASKDPVAAAADALKLPESPGRKYVIGRVAESWAHANPKAAVEWISHLSNAEEKHEANNLLVLVWTPSDPKAAAQHVSALPPGPDHDELVVTLIRAWPKRDYAGAAAWLQGLPPIDFAKQARNFSELWARQDPAAALNWASALPASEARDAAIAGLSERLPGEQAREAMQLATTIKDPEMRWNAMLASARNWFAFDVDAATKWVAKSDLSSDEKRKLLATAGSR